MEMTFEAYESQLDTYSKYPNTTLSDGYGITADDIEEFKKGREKYVPFLIYLSTRPWYRLENRIDKEFDNDDALPCDEAANTIDDLLYDFITLVD